MLGPGEAGEWHPFSQSEPVVKRHPLRHDGRPYGGAAFTS